MFIDLQKKHNLDTFKNVFSGLCPICLLCDVSSALRAVPTTLSWASCSVTLCFCFCFLSVGHGTLPHLCGNLRDVLVSDLLQKCYRSSQNLPNVYEQYGTAPIQPISTEMLILLTVYYLVQLGENNSISVCMYTCTFHTVYVQQ